MALSSRAHAFSVDALVGNAAKRKLLDLERDGDGSLPEPGAEKGALGTCQALDKKSKGERREEAKEPIQVDLQGSELWKRFHEIGTEMIITKAGRRMFPSVRVKVKGLDPVKQYYIAIDVVPVDSKRYRYVYHSSQWMVAGNTDHSCIAPRLYIHPDSPCSGETWARQVISFDRVKLTNNEMDDKGHIILQSMHKYKPRVHVIVQDSRFDLSQIQSLPAAGVHTFSFKETEFTTVTAYQNQQITKLKIDRNPFAKGFRDPGRNRGVLDGLLESYSWRPSFTLDFKSFGAEVHGGRPGSSPVTPPGGAPSVFSSSCSPPTFQLTAANLGLTCPDAYLHHLGLPVCYKICPASLFRPQPLAFAGPRKLASASGSGPRFTVEVPALSSLSIANNNIKGSKAEDPSRPGAHGPGSVSHVLYGLHAAGDVFPAGPVSPGALGCSLHPAAYSLYGYNLSLPPRLSNPDGPFKANNGGPPSLRESRCGSSPWPPTIHDCL